MSSFWRKMRCDFAILRLISTVASFRGEIWSLREHLIFRENDDTYFDNIIPRIILYLSFTMHAKANEQKSRQSDFELKGLWVWATLKCVRFPTVSKKITTVRYITTPDSHKREKDPPFSKEIDPKSFRAANRTLTEARHLINKTF